MSGRREEALGSGMVLLATLCLALKGIFAIYALRTGMSVAALLVLRVCAATPVIVIVSIWLSPPRARVRTCSPQVRSWSVAVLAGLFALGAAACDFAAVSLIGAGLSRVLLFSFPGFILLSEAIWARRMPSPLEMSAFASAWVGLMLAALPDGPGTLVAAQLSGVLLALLGAVLYAGFLLVGQQAMRSMSSPKFTAISSLGSLVAVLGATPFVVSGQRLPDGSGVFWVAVIVLVSTVVPMFAMAEGVSRIGAGRAGLLALVGPPTTIVLAHVLLDEDLALTQVLGCGVVLVAVGVLSVLRAARIRMRARDALGEAEYVSGRLTVSKGREQ